MDGVVAGLCEDFVAAAHAVDQIIPRAGIDGVVQVAAVDGVVAGASVDFRWSDENETYTVAVLNGIVGLGQTTNCLARGGRRAEHDQVVASTAVDVHTLDAAAVEPADLVIQMNLDKEVWML